MVKFKKNEGKRFISLALLAMILVVSIQFNGYAASESNIVTKIGNKPVSDILVVEKDNEYLLPLRGIVEELGFEVKWEQDNFSARVEKGDSIFIVKPGVNQVIATGPSIEGSAIMMNSKPEIIDNKTMVTIEILELITGLEITAKDGEILIAYEEVVENEVRLEDDFYTYINKEWLDKAVLPEDGSTVGGYEEMDANITKLLKADLNALLNDKSIKKSKELQSFVDYYGLALDYTKRNAEGLEPIKPYLEKIEKMESLVDFNDNYKDFVLNGIATPISFEIMADFENTDANALYFKSPGAFLEGKEDFESTFIEALVLLGKSEAEAKMTFQEAMEFDKTIVAYGTGMINPTDIKSAYNPVPMKDFSAKVKSIEFEKSLSSLVGKLPANIIAMDLNYYNDFDKIFNEETFNNMKSWMYLNLLSNSSNILSDDLGLLVNKTNGMEALTDGEERAFELSTEKFSGVIGDFYGKKYFSPEGKEDIGKMVEGFVEAYKTRMKELDWLSEETKAKAIKKLDYMKVQVGYPEEIEEIYTKYNIDKNKSFYENTQEMTRLFNENNYSNFNKAVNRDKWPMGAHQINAMYMPLTNTIVFPAAILQEPFYSVNQSSSANLGGIGAVIAHEISHAFDPMGALFDEKGNMSNWWTKEDLAKYEEKTEEMVKLFDGIEFAGGKVNGKQTLNENIADAGGLSVAYEVAKNYDDFNGEEFFRNWATIWRNLSSLENQQLELAEDIHSPNQVRANVQLSILEGFYETYKIEENDKMYIAPENRVKIW